MAHWWHWLRMIHDGWSVQFDTVCFPGYSEVCQNLSCEWVAWLYLDRRIQVSSTTCQNHASPTQTVWLKRMTDPQPTGHCLDKYFSKQTVGSTQPAGRLSAGYVVWKVNKVNIRSPHCSDWSSNAGWFSQGPATTKSHGMAPWSALMRSSPNHHISDFQSLDFQKNQ